MVFSYNNKSVRQKSDYTHRRDLVETILAYSIAPQDFILSRRLKN